MYQNIIRAETTRMAATCGGGADKEKLPLHAQQFPVQILAPTLAVPPLPPCIFPRPAGVRTTRHWLQLCQEAQEVLLVVPALWLTAHYHFRCPCPGKERMARERSRPAAAAALPQGDLCHHSGPLCFQPRRNQKVCAESMC